MRRAAWAPVLLLLLAGCLAFPEPGSPLDCTASSQSHILSKPAGASDPRQPWDALLWLEVHPSPEALRPDRVPSGWTSEIQHLTPPGLQTGLHRIRLAPEGNPEGGPLSVAWDARTDPGSSCVARVQGSATAHVGAPSPGELAVPGKGAHVYTAGFWENGTLFYTNMDRVHNDTNWPRAGWYAYGGGDPLPVYVYDKTRNERPAYWGVSTPPSPVPGVPSATVTPWNYFTTIEGFNEALKGLSTTTARAVHIPPEKAYTIPGQESHPLFGSAIVFYIEVIDVVDLPCADLPSPTLPPYCETPLPSPK